MEHALKCKPFGKTLNAREQLTLDGTFYPLRSILH